MCDLRAYRSEATIFGQKHAGFIPESSEGNLPRYTKALFREPQKDN
jgi:hypothetical protein